MMAYDLIVIGSGSAGMGAALEAKERGARVLIVEAGTIGGTCVNVGCVPSKTLLRAAEAYHKATHSPFAGVRPKGAALDFAEVIRQKDALIHTLRQEKYADVLEAAGIPLLQGTARFLDAERLQVNDQTLTAGAYVLATGAAPTLPPIPGLAEAQPWTYIEALSPEALPESLVVIGGGPIGLELAQAYARFGTRVTVLEALPYLLPAEDPELTTALRGYLAAEGLEIHTNARVTRVERDGAYRVHTTNGAYTAERLLVATGRRPRTQGLGLEAAGVEVGRAGEVRVDAHLRSTNPRIFAAGDVAGLPQFVYVGAQSGRVAARNALGEETPLDLTAVPRVTFTDPALAAVGLTEEAARQAHGEVRTARLPLEAVPKALAAADTRGLIKLVVDAEGTVLGVHVLAPEAGEVLQEGILAVKHALHYRDLIDTFHPYLTLAEGLRLVAQALDTDVHKLSCCA